MREEDANTCLRAIVTDQTDPWQVVPRQVFTPYDCLLISVALLPLALVISGYPVCKVNTHVLLSKETSQQSYDLKNNNGLS